MFINYNKQFSNIFLSGKYNKIYPLKQYFCNDLQKPNLLKLGFIFPEDPNNNLKIIILSLFLGSLLSLKNKKF